MCEFCHKHGEGKKWYLKAQNYSEDLLSDLRRRKFIQDFFSHPQKLSEDLVRLDDLNGLPSFVRSVVTPFYLNRQKKVHYGQVVPLEEIEHIFSLVNSIVRLACICRQASLGTEQRYCFALSMVPPKESNFGQIIRSLGAEYLTGPHTSGLEVLSKGEALDQFQQLEKKSLCHTVWTYLTPFIGTICNCDRSDCIAMKSTMSKSFPSIFRAEYVAEVNPEFCNGCRLCMRACQFGAMGYSIAHEKVIIDPTKCYGCGICRASCIKNAITLKDRSTVAVAANLW